MSFDSEPFSFADPCGLKEEESSWLYSVLYHSSYQPEFAFSENVQDVQAQDIGDTPKELNQDSPQNLAGNDCLKTESEDLSVNRSGAQNGDKAITNELSSTENAGSLEDSLDKKSGLYSKTYERRNRKKRPPGYYVQPADSLVENSANTTSSQHNVLAQTLDAAHSHSVQNRSVDSQSSEPAKPQYSPAAHSAQSDSKTHSSWDGTLGDSSKDPEGKPIGFKQTVNNTPYISPVGSTADSQKIADVSVNIPNKAAEQKTVDEERTCESYNIAASVASSEPSSSVPDDADFLKDEHTDATSVFSAQQAPDSDSNSLSHQPAPSDNSQCAVESSDQTVEHSVHQEAAPAAPTKSSWASLFKGVSPSVPAKTIAYVDHLGADNKPNEETTEENTEIVTQERTNSNEAIRQFGEILRDHAINHQTVAFVPRGLMNRANWCYVNSTLQALLACPPFCHLMKALPADPVLSRGPSSTHITDTIVNFVNQFTIFQKGSVKGPKKQDLSYGSPFEPVFVYKMLQNVQNSSFKMGRQEDAEEFLSCVLNGIHEEMLAAVKYVYDKSANTDLSEANGFAAEAEDIKPDDEADDDDDDQWEQVGPKNKSVITRLAKFEKTPISEIFGGQMRSVLHQHGSKESATLEPFFTMQLDIQSESVWTLKDALQGLVSKEALHGFTNAKTKAEVEASRKMSLEELPPVLILHLKCFVYDKNGGSLKIVKKVDYTIDLEIGKELLSPSVRSKYHPGKRMYKLFAVVNHHGTKAIGGHYTTDFYHAGIGSWVHASDNIIQPIAVPNMLKHIPPRMPYLLYYRRCDLI